MSARAERENPIRYLSVDEMMLKIAAMRAAQVVPRKRVVHSPPAPLESVQPPHEVEFPDYLSHCEAWSAAVIRGTEDRTAAIAPVEPPHPSPVVPRVSALM